MVESRTPRQYRGVPQQVCAGEDSNLHARRAQALNLPRMPIPPPALVLAKTAGGYYSIPRGLVKVMRELPLFPLNTVLFPGMPIALHVFEERYKEMARFCLANDRPFGVVLIRRGAEALGPLPETYTVGCTAKISETKRLEQGRMNIAAIGKERFRIVSLRHDKPYLIGYVQDYPLVDDDSAELDGPGRILRTWITRYADILAKAGDIELDPTRFPHDPIALAYFGAILLQMPAHQKQPLLETASAHSLLTDIRRVFRREVALLDAMLRCSPEPDATFFPN